MDNEEPAVNRGLVTSAYLTVLIRGGNSCWAKQKNSSMRTKGGWNKNNSNCDTFNYHQQGVKSEPRKKCSCCLCFICCTAIIVDASGTPQAGDVEG